MIGVESRVGQREFLVLNDLLSFFGRCGVLDSDFISLNWVL